MPEPLALNCFVFLSPDLTTGETRTAETPTESVQDFLASKWEQGWNADERVMQRYGNWNVYNLENRSLIFQDTVQNLAQQ